MSHEPPRPAPTPDWHPPMSPFEHFLAATGLDSKHLWLGAPALVVAAAALILLVAGRATPAHELASRHLEAGDRAQRVQDYRTARACYRRAIALGHQSPEASYNLATCLGASGEFAAAVALMAALAPTDAPGFAPAHLWLAKQLLRQPDRAPAAKKEVEQHLLQALRTQPDLTEARILLGQRYYAEGRLDEAEEHLRPATASKPELRLALASLYTARGDRDRARQEATKARDYFRARAKAAPRDRVPLLAWAQASLVLEDYPNAVAALKKGLEFPDNAAVRRSLGGAYASWARALAAKPGSDPGARLRLLEEGLRYAPGDPALLQPLIAMANLQGAEADRARAVLRQILVEGRPSAVVHMLLGLDAWKRGRGDEARVHMEQAYRLAPDAASIANDLAWMLANAPEPDLERALKLADAAVERAPDNPHARDTRGRILLKQKRWKEALADLERALRALPDDPALHQALATAYDGLGMAEIAAMHRSKAESKPKK